MSWDISSKWPAVYVWGDPVSPERAREIILRTDGFFSTRGGFGNDEGFTNRLVTLAMGKPYNISLWKTSNFSFDKPEIIRAVTNAFRKEIGYIELSRMYTRWFQSPYVFGPDGWVNEDGKVHLLINFGKYPNIGEIENDFKLLCRHFPEIKINMDVWDHKEHTELYECDDDPTFSWFIEDGAVIRTQRTRKNLPIEFTEPNFSITTNETNWTLKEIEERWGEHFERTRKVCEEAFEKIIRAEE